MTQPDEASAKPRHYPLTNEEWLRVTQELKPAEIIVLYHLRTLTPFGEHSTPIGVREMAKTLAMNPGTVSRALKRLDHLGYIDLELVQVNVKVLSKGVLFDRKHPASEDVEECCLQTTVLSTNNTNDLQTTPVIATQHLRSVDNTCPSEPLPSKGFRSPKTIKTIKTDQESKREKTKIKNSTSSTTRESSYLQPSNSAAVEKKIPEKEAIAPKWDKFSAPGDDPEFFEFVVRRTTRLPQPPADARCAAEGWIRKQGHILYPQYLEWKEGQERSAPKADDVLPLPDVLPELTPEQRLAKYQAMWQAPVCRKGIKEAIAAHPEWGIQIGKAGPEAGRLNSVVGQVELAHNESPR